MVRVLGLGKKKHAKKRLSPTAQIVDVLDLSGVNNPMYQYAINEFSQTVEAGTSNDDGHMIEFGSESSSSVYDELMVPQPPSTLSNNNNNTVHVRASASTDDSMRAQPPSRGESMAKSPSSTSRCPDVSVYGQQSTQMMMKAIRSPFEAEMLDTAAYEELYGDAYTGGPIKYVYPSGYQSMRPRSCPWKLSIVVCVLFTWLSVFIVGHCSDQVDQSQYRNDEIDDDSLVIDIRWCGSRALYTMWVASMLITGLAGAYCSVIGYIKVRDFAVANIRSHQPGIGDAKSDYYVRIDDNNTNTNTNTNNKGIHPAAAAAPPGSDAGGSSSAGNYLKTIYQADGTPQFWGAHIYRPTQAAVAITSR